MKHAVDDVKEVVDDLTKMVSPVKPGKPLAEETTYPTNDVIMVLKEKGMAISKPMLHQVLRMHKELKRAIFLMVAEFRYFESKRLELMEAKAVQLAVLQAGRTAKGKVRTTAATIVQFPISQKLKDESAEQTEENSLAAPSKKPVLGQELSKEGIENRLSKLLKDIERLLAELTGMEGEVLNYRIEALRSLQANYLQVFRPRLEKLRQEKLELLLRMDDELQEQRQLHLQRGLQLENTLENVVAELLFISLDIEDEHERIQQLHDCLECRLQPGHEKEIQQVISIVAGGPEQRSHLQSIIHATGWNRQQHQISMKQIEDTRRQLGDLQGEQQRLVAEYTERFLVDHIPDPMPEPSAPPPDFEIGSNGQNSPGAM
jgi:hypothetical protein